MIDADIVIYAAILGLLIGIIWSLRYVVIIDKKISRVETKIEKMLMLRRGRK